MTDDKCDLLFGALGLGNFRTLEFGSSCCTTRGIPKTIPPPGGPPPVSIQVNHVFWWNSG